VKALAGQLKTRRQGEGNYDQAAQPTMLVMTAMTDGISKYLPIDQGATYLSINLAVFEIAFSQDDDLNVPPDRGRKGKYIS
jgi:hypothetical protein